MSSRITFRKRQYTGILYSWFRASELEEKSLHCTLRTCFGSGYEPITRQTTQWAYEL